MSETRRPIDDATLRETSGPDVGDYDCPDDELYADEETGAELLANWTRHSAEDQKRARESFGMSAEDVSKMTSRIGHGR